jgi:hypothetical protein
MLGQREKGIESSSSVSAGAFPRRVRSPPLINRRSGHNLRGHWHKTEGRGKQEKGIARRTQKGVRLSGEAKREAPAQNGASPHRCRGNQTVRTSPNLRAFQD